MVKRYDLLVIGTGEAGSTAASVCKSAGWNVAIADKRPFGGTCSLRGCNPKKVLVGAAEARYRAVHLYGKGIDGTTLINWPDLMKHKQSLVDPIPIQTEEKFRAQGIDTYHGAFFFIGRNRLSNGKDEIEADHIVLATGAKPRPLNIPGEEKALSSDQFLSQTKLPSTIVFIGGGYISFEFAHCAVRAGKKVTILEALPKPLMQFDQKLVEMLTEASRDEGIDLYVDSPVKSIEDDMAGKKKVVTGNGVFSCDIVVHGAGRVPDIDGLKLEDVDIRYDKKGVLVNEYLQCISNPSVYVAGDAHGGGIPLTPAADMEGMVVGHNLINGNSMKPDYSSVPSVVFTLPTLSSVGFTEERAKEQNIDFIVHFQDTSMRHITRRSGFEYSAFKLLEEKGTGKIIGAHLLGHNADEIVNIFALAMKHKMTVEDLKHQMWAFPTVMYDIGFRL